jgi:hypothetical protein
MGLKESTMIIPTSSTITRLPLLLPLAFVLAIPLEAADGQRGNHNTTVTVLYEGPLLHEEDWTIKSGPVGPDNQKLGALGGTCSMLPSDVSVTTGSGHDRVIFESEYTGLGVWKMAWAETMSGSVSNGDEWHEQMRIEFSGTTTDGKAPKPDRSLPSLGNDGFLQPVPSNVLSDSLDLTDLFILQPPGGDIDASSRVHWVLRRQIPQVTMDPPPDYFPVVLFDRYIVNLHDQLAGQLGCDPL